MASGSTTRAAIPYPLSTDTPNIPGDVEALASRVAAIIMPYQAVSSLPAAGNDGFVYRLTTGGGTTFYIDTGSVLEPVNSPVTTTLWLPATWAVSGPFDATSGADAFLPPMFVPVPTGQTVQIVEVRTAVRSGSCTVALDGASSPLAGLGAMSVTTAMTTYTPSGGPVSLTDAEPLQPSILAVSGNPDGLSITAVLAYSVTSQD